MTHMTYLISVAKSIGLIACLAALPTGGAGLSVNPKSNATLVEVSTLLPKEKAEQLPAGKMTQDDGEKWLDLRLVTDGKAGPAMLGSYERAGLKLLFVPRFPLQHEKTYQARALIAGMAVETVTYTVPARAPAPPAEVIAVWPTDDKLPANQLRFYIQFSRPMRGGEDIFRQICLEGADGKKIADPWLGDELWNEDGTLLTLYIHPGRIKWGVLLRLLLGPVFEPDREYTLVVKADMLDAEDRKLAKEYRKKFRTTAEDRTRIDLSTWKIEPPAAGVGAVRLTFPKALDHRGLASYVKVVDAAGKAVAGKVEVGRDGRSWQFVPAAAWTNQDYSIAVDPRLEDVAGNSPVQPFDVEAGAPVPPAQRMSVPFRPHTPPSPEAVEQTSTR